MLFWFSLIFWCWSDFRVHGTHTYIHIFFKNFYLYLRLSTYQSSSIIFNLDSRRREYRTSHLLLSFAHSITKHAGIKTIFLVGYNLIHCLSISPMYKGTFAINDCFLRTTLPFAFPVHFLELMPWSLLFPSVENAFRQRNDTRFQFPGRVKLSNIKIGKLNGATFYFLYCRNVFTLRFQIYKVLTNPCSRTNKCKPQKSPLTITSSQGWTLQL